MAVFSAALLASASLMGIATAEPVAMPIGRLTPRQHIAKRADPSQVTLVNNVTSSLYYINVTVGTPGQTVGLQLDTGSSDVWMFSPDACSEAQCLGGSFNGNKSSSYKSVDSLGEFQIQYVTPGSGVNGTYFTDDVAIGSIKLTNVTMAVADSAQQVDTGIMGVGFDVGESIAAESEGQIIYPSIIDVMKNESVINSHAYSLWLDDLEASTGTILFGGYDTGKYSGHLTVLDIQPDAQSQTISSFTVAWTLLALTDSTGTTVVQSQFPYAAVLDSGTTLMAVPDDIFETVGVYFGAEDSETYGPIVPCSIASWKGTLDFGFGGDGGPIIQVPFSELAIPTTDENGNPLKFPHSGEAACAFGLQASPQEGTYLLGDTFLRSAYVVYDIDEQQLAIAQTIYNSSDSHVSAISAGTALQSQLPSASYATGATITASTGLQDPGFGFGTATGTDVGATSAVAGSGSLSHIAGVKTTLSLASLSGVPTGAAAATGGSGTSASASASSSKGAAAALAPAGGDRGVLYTLLTAVVMMVAGGAMFVTF